MTNTIVLRGLQEEVLILLAAQRFYIEHGSDSEFEKLDNFVRNWLTADMLDSRGPMYYVDKVIPQMFV